jgi:hypothetical protein
MKKRLAFIVLWFLSATCSVPAFAQMPRNGMSESRASRKINRKQQKAQKRYTKAQRKAERKMLKAERKNTRYPSRSF